MTTDLAPLEAPLRERSFDDLLAEAARFHGHLCPGQVLGVRMALCRPCAGEGYYRTS